MEVKEVVYYWCFMLHFDAIQVLYHVLLVQRQSVKRSNVRNEGARTRAAHREEQARDDESANNQREVMLCNIEGAR